MVSLPRNFFSRIYTGELRLVRAVHGDLSASSIVRVKLPHAGLGNRILHLANIVLESPHSIVRPVGRFGASSRTPTILDNRIRGRINDPEIRVTTYRGPVRLGDDLIPLLEGINQFPLRLADGKTTFDSDFTVLHVRLGDFLTSRPDAVMRNTYFVRAASLAREEYGGRLFIISDQPQHEQVLNLFCELTANGYQVEIATMPAQDSLRLLAGASTVIASPSTFSICGAWLGNGRIIFEQGWVERAAGRGSAFWSSVQENRVPHLNVSILAE